MTIQLKKLEKKQWWKGNNVIKIRANHWRTFLMGIKIGRIIGFKLQVKREMK